MSSKSTFSNSTSASYALALYELAKESSELAKVEEEMKSIDKLLKENSDFKEMILSLAVTKEEKKAVIKNNKYYQDNWKKYKRQHV